MPLRDHDKRAAIADKYGWKILGWAVEEHNPAGITVQSKWDSLKFLRFQHKDPLKLWESTLKENAQKKPRAFKAPPKPKTWDDFKSALQRIVKTKKLADAHKIAKAVLG